MTLAPSEEKLKHVSQQCWETFKQPKVNWPVIINCPGHFTSSNLVSRSSAGANISSTERRVLQWSCDSGKFSQEITTLVSGKLETFQCDEH